MIHLDFVIYHILVYLYPRSRICCRDEILSKSFAWYLDTAPIYFFVGFQLKTILYLSRTQIFKYTTYSLKNSDVEIFPNKHEI